MKKILFVMCLTAALFCGCKESKYEKRAEAYAGPYNGGFTTLLYSTNTTLDTVKEVTVTQSHSNMENLVMEGGFELSRTKEAYVYSNDAPTHEQLESLRKLCGVAVLDYPQDIVRFTMEVKFYSMNMTIFVLYYNEDGDAIARTTFTGTKR